MSLSNQSYEIQPSSINLHPNEYNQELDCYPFALKLDKCVGSCDTLNDYLLEYVFQIKQDLNIHVFIMITGKNEWKILTKDILCKCKLKFDG